MGPSPPDLDLDRWIEEPVLRTRHRREGRSREARLWAAAGTVRLRDARILGRLIRARIPGLRADMTFQEMFRRAPFNLLEEGRGYTLSALCGRIWTMRGDFASLAEPEDFLTWQVPGTARVLFANWVEPTEGGAALMSEVRIAPVDRRAAIYVRSLGPFIAAFQGLVAAEPMKVAVQRASKPGQH